MEFSGRTAIVIRAESKLGRAHALGLPARGANVVANALSFKLNNGAIRLQALQWPLANQFALVIVWRQEC
jgi:NAD(P)-dependent dehydrogenase (short-subunit alcohol dehydrogenase family)